MSFHHYPNPESFFHRLYRVLCPGERLILRDMASTSAFRMWIFNHIEIPFANKVLHKGDIHAYSGEDIQQLCRASGLKPESYEFRNGFRLHCVVRKRSGCLPVNSGKHP